MILAELALSPRDREFPGSGNGFRPRERLTGIFDTPRPEGAGILVSQSLLAFAGLTTNRGRGYNSTSVTLGMPS